MGNPTRGLVLAGAVLSLATACATGSIYRSMDVVTVADDPGAVVLPRAPGERPVPAVFEPYRARATWESLPRVEGIPGERAFPVEAVGDGRATRGRIHVRVYEGRTRDGRSPAERTQVVRCESDDSGAWYFDGEQVRARLPRDGSSWLVWQLGQVSRFALDDRLLEGRDSRWEGGILEWRPGPRRTVRTAFWEVEVESGPGFCLQFAEEPGGSDCVFTAVGELAESSRNGEVLGRGARVAAGAGDVLEVRAADGSTARLRIVRRVELGARLRLRISRGGPVAVGLGPR